MGLLKHLLFWPVTGPEFLVKFSLGKVEQTVRDQLVDDQSVKEELLALQMRLQVGGIDDERYVEEEAALMQRRSDVRCWRERVGMGTPGGPVQGAREDRVEAAGPAASPFPDGRGEDGVPPRGGIASPGGATVEFD